MKRIVVTGADTPYPIYISTQHIVAVQQPSSTETNPQAKAYIIVSTGERCVVTESPQEILDMIDKADRS